MLIWLNPTIVWLFVDFYAVVSVSQLQGACGSVIIFSSTVKGDSEKDKQMLRMLNSKA